MVVEVTRHVHRREERELWARSAGRCQFSGCNQLLYRSSVTQESVHIPEKAHIYSFSENGPRGWGPFRLNLTAINDISNLMLVCHGCHKKIDQCKDGGRYDAELLTEWKGQHEQRVEIVTGINPNKKSHVVLYGANIGKENSLIQLHECLGGMFPNWYPAAERPIELSMRSELRDKDAGYWAAEKQHLKQAFERYIVPIIQQDKCNKHFSVFALAPQPLLILLGAILTDKLPVETYQLHREPRGWAWPNTAKPNQFVIRRPAEYEFPPALLLSLSDHVARERITRELTERVSIWELTVENPHNDFLKSSQQLSKFRRTVRELMVEIKKAHGNDVPLSVFPVMPIACAIELGRARMPKADMPWVLFDHDYATRRFVKTFDIGGKDDDGS